MCAEPVSYVNFEEKFMECSEPGAIRDEELVAFLEGERVRPTVIEHLAHCQQCSSQVELYRRLERKLTSKLYRWDCPSNQVLGDYQLGLLDREQALAVRAHLNVCVLCPAELATLVDFLAVDSDPMLAERSTQVATWQGRIALPVTPAVAPPAAFYPQAARIANAANDIKRAVHRVREESSGVLRQVAATLLPAAQPGLVFQRGSTPQQDGVLWPRNYVAENVTISLQLEQDPRQRDALQLIGLVMRQAANADALDGIPAQLLTAEGVVQTQRIDELGNVIFTALAPTTYALELLFPERTIVVEQIPVTLQN
jgi:hypothetical protein